MSPHVLKKYGLVVYITYMKKIYLIRHAETEAIRDGVLAGSTYDTLLTDEGRLQAAEAGKELARRNIDMIVSSPMLRTRETAIIIANAIGYGDEDILFNELFTERSYGSYEGGSFKEFARDYKNIELRSSIETTQELYDRVNKGLTWIRQLDAKRILLVSHGSTGRMIVLSSQNKNYDEHKSIKKICTAEVIELTLD